MWRLCFMHSNIHETLLQLSVLNPNIWIHFNCNLSSKCFHLDHRKLHMTHLHQLPQGKSSYAVNVISKIISFKRSSFTRVFHIISFIAKECINYWLIIYYQSEDLYFFRQFFRKTTQTSICIKAGKTFFCDQIKNRIFLVMWRKNVFQLGDNTDLNSSVAM